jgi:hypothetical protein
MLITYKTLNELSNVTLAFRIDKMKKFKQLKKNLELHVLIIPQISSFF